MAARIMDSHGPRVVGTGVPLNVILGAIPSLPRPVLARLTAKLIDQLDTIDGDPELEEADPIEDEDSNSDAAWMEQTDQRCLVPPLNGWGQWAQQEDDEEDDPPGGNVEDEGEEEQSDG